MKRCERELRPRLLPRPEVQRLVLIPGVGAVIAYTLLLEIDDIRRFPTARHFHSYCRLVPGADNSAGKTHHKRSRDGNRYLTLAFHHAAVRAIQYVPEIKHEYQRVAAAERESDRARARGERARDDRLRGPQ